MFKTMITTSVKKKIQSKTQHSCNNNNKIIIVVERISSFHRSPKNIEFLSYAIDRIQPWITIANEPYKQVQLADVLCPQSKYSH